MRWNLRYLTVVCACMFIVCVVSGCGGTDSGEPTTTETVVTDGEVTSPEEFSAIGLYIDVQDEDGNVTDVTYRISEDIAIVGFKYSGVKAEFRGSCKHTEYDLAGVENTSNGDMIVTGVQGYDATYYTLNPGRIAFWDDGTINYSLYLNVTASDEVLNEILKCVVFENRYGSRADVQQKLNEGSKAFAQQIIDVFSSKNLDAMADIMSYPQETGNGQSIANREELLALDKDELFTDILIKALTEEDALDNLRMTEDGSEYIIGTAYKNVHFTANEDGTFVITLINN